MRYLITFGIFLCFSITVSLAQCDLAVEMLYDVCDDNGTPLDPTDDVFYAWLDISGAGAQGWLTTDSGWPEGSGPNGLHEFGPYLLIDGSHTILIEDAEIADCSVEISVQGFTCDPAPCELTPTLLDIATSDAGTPGQCSDDTYTATVMVEALGTVSTGWRIESEPGSFLPGGTYGEAVVLGPYPLYIDGVVNNQNLLIADLADLGCNTSLLLEPTPIADCACELVAEVSMIIGNGGLADSCDDDEVLVAIQVENTDPNSTGSWIYTINGGASTPGGEYGEPVSLGIYPIFGPGGLLNEFTIEIWDSDDPGCSLSLFEYAPVPEEDCLCNVQLTYEIDPVVNSNGTPDDCTDDFSLLHFTDHSTDVFGPYEILLDNELLFTGVFGDAGGSVPVPADGQTHRLTMRGNPDYGCLEVYELPALETACPLNTVRFSIESREVCGEETICLPIKAENFDSILGFQFRVLYDPEVLEYNSIQGFNTGMIGFGIGGVGQPMPAGPLAPGQITIGWNDPLASGESLHPDSTLVELCFDLLNGGSFSTSISFDDDPVFLEVINADEQTLPVAFGANTVACACPLSFAVEQLPSLENGTPNLCLDDYYQLTLDISNPEAGGDTWEFVNLSGQVLFRGQYGVPYTTTPERLFNIVDAGLIPDRRRGFIRDSIATDCQVPFDFTVEIPDDCQCELNVIWELDQLNNDTPEDCSDDYYVINIQPRGYELGSDTWVASDNFGFEYSGIFDEWTALGPYSYAETEVLVITIADSADPFCSEVLYFPPLPNPCGGPVDTVEVGFDDEVACGELSFCRPIRVSNFNEVLAMQFSINYDTAALRYTGVQNFTPDLLAWTTTGVGQPMPAGSFPPGQMSIYWADPLAAGASLDDGTVLVEVCFEVLQETNHELSFTDQPLFTEFLDANEEVMEVNFHPLPFYCGPADLALDIKAVPGVTVLPEMSFLLDIELRNEGLRTGTGIEVFAPLPAGISFVGSDGNYDSETGLWQVDTLDAGRDSVLHLQLYREASGDSLFLAEITMLNEEDIDSTPGSGVDTDADGHLADDPDDEDDGDAWMPCPLELGSITVVADTVCLGTPLSWNWNGDAVLPDGFVIGVAVYEATDTAIPDFLTFTTGQSMDLPEGASTNQSYFARLVAGPVDGGGGINFADNCVRFGPVWSVMWREVSLANCSDFLQIDCSTPTIALYCDGSGLGDLIYNWSYDGVVVSDQPKVFASVPGVYELVATDASGCSATQNFTVVGDFEAPVVTISQSGSLCGPGGAVQLSAEVSGGTFMRWVHGPVVPVIEVTEPGTYTALGIGNNGCTSFAEALVEPAQGECNVLSGHAFASDDCVAAGTPLANWLIEITGDDFLEYRQTNLDGEYEIYLPQGDFHVQLLPYSPVWTACEVQGYDLSFSGTDETVTQNLLATPVDNCPLLEVAVNVGNLRLCSEDRILTFAYENVGSDTLWDGLGVLVLPEELSFASSSGTVLGGNGDSIFFAVDLPLAPGAGGQFTVYVDVSCEAEWGSTVCVQALGFPYGPCPAAPEEWSGGSLALTAECVEEEVVFTLRNNGDGTLSSGSTYIIIQDGVMLLEAPEEVPTLLPGESSNVPLPANGSTYVLEAEQEPFHPGFSHPIAIIEGCGTNDEGEVSTGFVNQFPTDDEDFYVDIDCREITAAYDPNDKQAEPLGYGDEHYIVPERTLEYTIRFQNTGNDTAQTVVIRDTLSDWLDMCTLRPGISSHPYRLELDSAHAIAFVFDNILLPDSTTNLPGSQGFVEYSVKPKADAPLETRIENTAAIYFDINPPIFTNTTYHTLGRDFLDILDWVENPATPLHWRFGPNPNPGILNIEYEATVGEVTLSLINLWGQQQGQYQLAGGQAQLNLRHLPSGYYSILVHSKDGQLLATGKLIKG